MSEEKKQRLKEYQKSYREAKKIILKKKLLSIIQKNKEAIKEKLRERYKNLSRKEKDKINEYQRMRFNIKYQESVQYKKEALKNNFLFFA